jgi:hypothetical protein
LIVLDRHLVQTTAGFEIAYAVSGFSCNERRIQIIREIELSRLPVKAN